MQGAEMKSFCSILTAVYIVLCLAALALIPLNAAGLAGEPDPLAGVFAVLLAAPWFWLVEPFTSDNNTVWNVALAAACMALNALIVRSLCGLLAGRFTAPPPG